MATVQKGRIDTRVPATGTKPAAVTTVPNEKIAARAYEIWQASGRPHGHDQEHWLQAERELRSGKH